MWWVFAILFTIVGILAGAVGSIIGIGGGVFFVPALLFLGNLLEPGSITPQMATGTSLAVIVITALSSTLAYLKQKKVDVESAGLFFAGSAPGAVAGVYVNKLLSIQSFSLLFGLFQLGMFALLLMKDRLKPRTITWHVRRTWVDGDGVEHEYGYNRWIALAVAFLVGFISSLFGVGGGILIVPALIVLFRFPPHVAAATSMCVILLSALVGSATNAFNQHIHWLYVLALAPGAWLGGKWGAVIAARLKGQTLVLVLRVLILGVAAQMIGKALVS